MSKGFEWCKKRASDPSMSGYADKDWSKAREICPTGLFSMFPSRGDVIVKHDPDAGFQYFTSASLVHDGTLKFFRDACVSCVSNVMTRRTYFLGADKPLPGEVVKYTVGNFVVLDEYGDKFAPEGRPWMKSCTTVLLPVKYEVLHEG